MAAAAYEHDEETMPNAEARITVAGRWLPIRWRIASRATNAWTAPDKVKPRTSAQSVAQNM
jgi:hypothetical protein